LLPDFRIRQRDYLLEITRAITQELNLDNLLTRILSVSVELLAGQAGMIVLRSDQGGWSVATSQGIPSVFMRYLEPLLADISDGQEKARSELRDVNRILQNLTRYSSLGFRSGVGLPMGVRERVIGVIFIFRNYAGSFSSNDRALLQSFADQAAIAVHNAKLYTQVSREKQRMDALLDSAADGILILDSDHVIERCNPAMARILGIAMKEIIGRPHEVIIRWTNTRDGVTLEDAEAGGWPMTPNATLYVEGDLYRVKGVSLPVGITYAPLLDENGNLINVIATVRDITRFREAEELKSTFISVISHELKTPVALIKGYAGTLRREDASWDRSVVKDSLEVIEEEADRLTELIENLLDASRLQAGVLEINLTDVVDKFAQQIADRFRTQTSEHTIVVEFPPNFPVVLADEDRLAQVFSNLLSNAIKYSPEGGEIRIEGQVQSQKQVVVCISDQGPGIAPGDIPHVFDRFYRAKEASRTTKGAGLGLYLARAIIEAHGGRIWVDPMGEIGARICFSLPREASER